MTLSVSHGAFDGLCSEFRDWRCAIARAAGYGIVDDGSEPAHILLDYDSITDENIVGVWPAAPADPLLILFAH
jgi:hypothetical protein